jgi:D-alanyl-D-alanine carboxypeptidase
LLHRRLAATFVPFLTMNLKRKISAASLLAMLAWLPLSAQTVPPGLAEYFEQALDSMRTVLNVKGLGASVQISDDAVWAGGAGISSVNPLDSIGPDHVFAIGSVNKTITAACVLQLADEGVLHLDDSLHQWLDPFPFVNPNITIRQLLRHQSGLYDFLNNPNYQPTIGAAPDSIWALADVLTTFMRPPLFAPGTGWSYCNTNYLLLGLIIEKATEQPFYEACRARFLTPLGLNTLNMPPFEPFPAQVAHLWLDLNGDGVVDDAHSIFSTWDAWYSSASPAGSYYSTPTDMARWMRAYMSGTFLSPDMMAEMKATVLTTLPGGTQYGLGIMDRGIFGQQAYGHGGDAGYSASVWYFPDKDISIAVLNNDQRKNSWALAPVVAALMKSYVTFESQTTENQEIASIFDFQVFPNPFVERLLVSLDLPVRAEALEIQLLNVLGEKVAVTTLENLPSGEHRVELSNLNGVPSGLYFLTAYLDGKTAQVWKVFKGKMG